MRNPYNLSKPDNPFRPIADSSNGNSLLTDTISSEKYMIIKKIMIFQFGVFASFNILTKANQNLPNVLESYQDCLAGTKMVLLGLVNATISFANLPMKVIAELFTTEAIPPATLEFIVCSGIGTALL